MRTLESTRLILRLLNSIMAETVFPILVQEIEGEGFSFADFQAEFQFDERLAQQLLGQWFGRPAVFLKPQERYIGFCTLMPRLCTPEELEGIDPVTGVVPGCGSIEAEIGWAISRLYRNQGLATEAARILLGYSFIELKLPRVVAFTEAGNLASVRVMQKLGMRTAQLPGKETVVGAIDRE